MKVGCSPITGEIYAGNVTKNMWSGKKHDVTNSAVNAVAQHLIQRDINIQFKIDDKTYMLKVEEVKDDTIRKSK